MESPGSCHELATESLTACASSYGPLGAYEYRGGSQDQRTPAGPLRGPAAGGSLVIEVVRCKKRSTFFGGVQGMVSRGRAQCTTASCIRYYSPFFKGLGLGKGVALLFFN
jgi:hypothetical protein